VLTSFHHLLPQIHGGVEQGGVLVPLRLLLCSLLFQTIHLVFNHILPLLTELPSLVLSPLLLLLPVALMRLAAHVMLVPEIRLRLPFLHLLVLATLSKLPLNIPVVFIQAVGLHSPLVVTTLQVLISALIVLPVLVAKRFLASVQRIVPLLQMNLASLLPVLLPFLALFESLPFLR
jgi:hypothetical protein